MKNPKKLGIKETYLTIVKAIKDKHMDHIILNSEKLKYSSEDRNKSWVPTLSTLI
jgi:hypothetical protein